MKFRWKLVIVTMLIVSFSFGFGGMLLIQNSYHATLKQEKRVARNSYETILRMLKKLMKWMILIRTRHLQVF